jgi:CheY-like chemotaxis protein
MSQAVPSPILIADDDDDDIFFAVRALKKAGITTPILTCNSGNELVDTLSGLLADAKGVLPRVVFLDVKMPLMGGLEALKWIRSQKRLNEVPVVMLSGSKEPRDTELARCLGADGYLVKYPPLDEFARAASTERVRTKGAEVDRYVFLSSSTRQESNTNVP